MKTLRYVAVVYAIAMVAHTADHLRRGIDTVTPEVLWAGTASSLVVVVAIALIFTGNRWAPAVATAVGFANAFGVAAVHLLPPWSVFSDSFSGAHVSALSWAAVLFEIAGAFAFGVAGLLALRRPEPGGAAHAA
jgi:hypothetical protein